MTRVVLFEDHAVHDFLPLVYWKTLFELRLGRRIILDRTSQRLGTPISGVWVREWLARVAAQRCGAPANGPAEDGTLLLNGRWVAPLAWEPPEGPCVGWIGEEIAFISCDEGLAQAISPRSLLASPPGPELRRAPRAAAEGSMFRFPWDIVRSTGDWLREDWRVDEATLETAVDSRTYLTARERIHVGENCRIHPSAVIDATEGPVYLSHDVTLGAHAVVEGPAYIGPGSRINAHAWLHGANAIGALCKLGGEVDGCVIDGYSNKQHHGFLGHSYVGSWVNLGAGATNSDLKNTYGTVRVPLHGTEMDSGEMFVGCFIGDHAKIGINATIPTGAVIGLAATAAASRVLPKFIPSFGWVSDDRVSSGDPARLLDVAVKVMARRNVEMTDEEVELFLELPDRAREIET